MYHKQSMDGDANAIIKASRVQMLRDALSITNDILQEQSHDDRISHRVTLLEGELVGALTMKIVIGDAIVSLMEGIDDRSELGGEIEAAMKELLLFGRKYILSGNLAPSECEVLYGRCGYLKGELFVLCCTVSYTRKFILTAEIICVVMISYQIHPNRDRRSTFRP